MEIIGVLQLIRLRGFSLPQSFFGWLRDLEGVFRVFQRFRGGGDIVFGRRWCSNGVEVGLGFALLGSVSIL